MRMPRWTIVMVLLCALVAGGCGRDDNMGSSEGKNESPVPSGAIPAPTDAPTTANPAAAGAPLDTGPAATDTVTPVVGK